MTKKKENSSGLPNGGFMLTDGTGLNWGLDGFFHDMDYGSGVEEGPSEIGLSGIPDGGELPPELTRNSEHFKIDGRRDDDYGFDADGLTAFFEEEVTQEGSLLREAALSNLQWLEVPNTGTDPERLPNPSPHSAVKELEEAWGTVTDGITIVPNRDVFREVDASLSRLPSESFQVKLDRVVKKAHRASALGKDLREVFSTVVSELGDRSVEARPHMSRLASEHGLAGKVFLRTSAYPGIHRGKWSQYFKQKFSSARYILDDAGVLGSDRLHGKQVVSNLPWSEAWDYYRPALRAAGHRVASTGNPRSDLRATLAALPEKSFVETNFPTHTAPADRVSYREAREAIKGRRDRQIVEKRNPKIAKAQKQIESMVKVGRLTRDQADSVWEGSSTPHQALRKATAFILHNEKAQKGTYTGPKAGYHNSSPEERKWKNIQASMPKESAEQVRVATTVRQWMSEGSAGNDLDDLLKARFATPVLQRNGTLIEELRNTHEGLSGNVYVDADAYVSKTGTSGCVQGAQKHRSSPVKHVLASSRCRGCIFNSRGTCQKYNKRLASKAPVKHPDVAQQKFIRLANADSSDRAAAISAPSYNPEEFGLQNEVLDQITVRKSAENLGDITWGGFQFGDD